MDNCKITVTAASGVESVTKRELKSLGYADAPAINGAITIDGTLNDIGRLNMFLRTADRVYLNLKEFIATSFDEVFDAVYSFDWANFIPLGSTVYVDGKSYKSKLFAVSALQSVIKKAIINKLAFSYKVNKYIEGGKTYKIYFTVYKDKVSLLLDTSGQGLHKRGYRTSVGAAPIKETLAAAILYLSHFSFDAPLIDPFCGTGTIPLEAARMVLNIASGILRHFDYENFPFMQGVYNNVYLEAKDNERLNKKLNILGSDIDAEAIRLANIHAKKAGLKDKVVFKTMDVKDLTLTGDFGTIVTNPPYGERLAKGKEALSLYKTLGNIYRKETGWSCYVITASNQFENAFNKKSDKNRKLYNSDIECHLFEYFAKNRG